MLRLVKCAVGLQVGNNPWKMGPQGAGDLLSKRNILQQFCRDQCGGAAELLTKGLDNSEHQ